MPAIHIPFGEETTKMFHDLIKVPVNELVANGTISQPDNNQTRQQHRNQVLDQGRANFVEGHEKLNAKQKALLYCFYYMQVHMASSYLFMHQIKPALKELTASNHTVIFVDFGCGPMTSGIAFRRHFAQPDLNLHYIGIDRATEMIEIAKQFQSFHNFFTDNQHFYWLNDYKQVNEILNVIIKKTDKYFVIYNYCYFFASRTINVSEICELISNTKELIKQNKLLILHQNPIRDDLNTNWNIFRNFILTRSLAQPMNGYPNTMQYTFQDLLGLSNYTNPTFTTYCDCLIT